MKILSKTKLIHTIAIALSTFMLAYAENINKQINLNDINLEISANPEINCGDILKVEVKLINASNKRFTFISEWLLPFNNIKLHFLDIDTRKDLNFWFLDHFLRGDNLVTLYPNEFVGRIFRFKLDKGKMILLNKRSSEISKEPALINLFDYDVQSKDFIIKATFMLDARLEAEKDKKSYSKDHFIYKNLGYLESNEIVINNLCKSDK